MTQQTVSQVCDVLVQMQIAESRFVRGQRCEIAVDGVTGYVLEQAEQQCITRDCRVLLSRFAAANDCVTPEAA